MTEDSTWLRELRKAAERFADPGSRGVHQAVSDLLAVAEAASELSSEYRHLHPTVPWVVLAEMGRVLRRAGEEADPVSLELTLRREMPELRQRLLEL
jgi:uncharacterized protein with HEPN domain